MALLLVAARWEQGAAASYRGGSGRASWKHPRGMPRGPCFPPRPHQRPRSDTIRAGLRHSELGSFQGLRSVVNPGAGAVLQSFPWGLQRSFLVPLCAAAHGSPGVAGRRGTKGSSTLPCGRCMLYAAKISRTRSSSGEKANCRRYMVGPRSGVKAMTEPRAGRGRR